MVCVYIVLKDRGPRGQQLEHERAQGRPWYTSQRAAASTAATAAVAATAGGRNGLDPQRNRTRVIQSELRASLRRVGRPPLFLFLF